MDRTLREPKYQTTESLLGADASILIRPSDIMFPHVIMISLTFLSSFYGEASMKFINRTCRVCKLTAVSMPGVGTKPTRLW